MFVIRRYTNIAAEQEETVRVALESKDTKLGFFGSYDICEKNQKSDLDVLVEFCGGNSVDLFDFIELENFLTEQHGIKVD